MKRTCLQRNTNTDEQNTCEFHLAEIPFEGQLFDPREIQEVKSFVQMKKLLLLIILIIPLLLKAGTTVIHVDTEGWGTFTGIPGEQENNIKGCMFWNGTKWVTNNTAAHMFYTDLRTGERLKNYRTTNVSDRTANSPVFDSLSYHITRQNYQYAYPAKQGGTYKYEAVEYLIRDTTERQVVIRSRGTGNGIENSYFDIFVEVVPNQITAIRNDPQWFTYPAGMSMEEALEQTSPTQYLTGTLPTTDGYYFMDLNGGSDMGGISYNFHTGLLTGDPNTTDLSPAYPIDFMLKFMDSIHQLEEFEFLPKLISETYISPEPPTVITGEILDLKSDSALVLGEITSDGGLPVSERGVVFSTSENPTIGNGTKAVSFSADPVNFNALLTGLIPNTTYFVRSYAINSTGTAYSENRRFKTPVTVKNSSVGLLPQNLAVNRVTNKVYVANNIGNSVSVINGETGNNEDTISVGKAPYYVGINEKTNMIYVPNNIDNTVSVINGVTGIVDTTVLVGSAPRAAVVNKTTNKIYVPADFTSNQGNVFVIDGENNLVENTVTVGQRPIAVAINETTNKIYVANNWGNSVTVIDGISTTTETVSVGNSPRFIAVNDSTNKVYVVNYRDSSVTVIDGETNSTNKVSLAFNAYPWAAAVNRLANKIYVLNSGTNTVTVIDGETNATKNINVGKAPQAVAVNEATNRIYVGNFNQDDRSNVGYIVTEIDGVTDEIVGLACVKNPAELAVNVKNNKTYVINGDKVMMIEETKPVISVSPNSLEVAAANGSTASFSVNSNIAWSVASTQNWLTITPKTGNGNGTITVTSTANPLVTTRVATVKVVMGYDVDTLSVQVIQSGIAPTLSVSPPALDIASVAGSSATFNVTSNTTWNVVSNQSWLTANVASGSGNNAVTIIAEANPLSIARTAIVTVSANGTTSKTVTVTQVAGAAMLSVSPVNLSIASAQGSTSSFNVTSNKSWTATSNQTWLLLNSSSGSGNGTVTLTSEENPSVSERTAIITVSAPGVASQTVTVTQITGNAILSVSSTALDILAAEGSTATFDVISNVSWSVVSDQTWLMVNASTGSGNGTVTLTSEENPTTKERTAVVTVSAPGVTSQKVTVTQASGVAILSVSSISLGIGAIEGSTASFNVASNTTWSASSDQAWLSLNPSSGTGNGTVTVTSEANLAVNERIVTITVSAYGLVSQTVTVTQLAGAATLSVSTTGLEIGAIEGSTASFSVASNTTWSALSDQTWLMVSPTLGTGNGTVTITAGANPLAAVREAIVTITATGAASQMVTVTQSARVGVLANHVEGISVFPNPFSDGFYVCSSGNATIVSVFDIRGRMIFTRKISGNEFIPSIQFENGIYLLELTNDRVTIKKKLIKN